MNVTGPNVKRFETGKVNLRSQGLYWAVRGGHGLIVASADLRTSEIKVHTVELRS